MAPAAGVVARGGTLEAGTILTTTESGRAAALISRELPGQPVSFDLILSSPALSATDRAFRSEVNRALAPLRADARVARIFSRSRTNLMEGTFSPLDSDLTPGI